MFHKKVLKAVLTAAVFFSTINLNLYAASGNITSLKLDFLRTEKVYSESQESSISGTIIYNKNPYVFIFMVNSPSEQTLYVNDENAFLISNGQVYDEAQNKDFLNQTCIDFLNWFKSDYGISEASFAASTRWIDNNLTVSQWDCYNKEDQPLDKILVWSDGQGRFVKLQMFVSGDSLVTQTDLSSFEYLNGISYPSTITSFSFENNSVFMTMELQLSNVHFGLTDDDYTLIDNLAERASLNNSELPENDLSHAQHIVSPATPAQNTYRVSIPSVVVSTSFSFYKQFITSQDMSNCPFYPTCSQFMLEAVSANGIFGFFQGLERLRRCTATEHARDQYPTLSNGKHYDPVPVRQK